MNSVNSKSRILWLDIARVLAITLVTFNHAVEPVYGFSIEAWNTYSFSANLAKTLINTVGRLGVPLFLAITGVLLLNKSFQSEKDIFHFYKHNLLPLLISVEIWYVIYFVIRYFYYGTADSNEVIIKTMLGISTTPLPFISHTWYMPKIIGIYFVIPFLAHVVQHYPLKALLFPMCFAFLYFIIYPSVNIFYAFLNVPAISTSFDVSYLGGTYGLYIVCGYYIGKDILKHIPSSVVFLTGFFMFSFTIWLPFYACQHAYAWRAWYDFIGIFVTGLCLFELIRRRTPSQISVRLSNTWQYISRISLGIFFVHMPVELILGKYINPCHINGTAKVFLIWILGDIISILVVHVLAKIPVIRKYGFIIK